MRFRLSDIAATALAWSLVVALPAHAQGVVQQATPDADELAGEMRLLAADPRDVTAMVRAGELTLKLGDTTAAAGFFARAERIDPSNPRIKAGKGSLLVQSGRPGEALLQFGQAEQLRGDVRRFAADRGLAYDLIGEQERAQRDYRLALRDGPADETLRRYALSLGISGKRDEALAVIDPLLRRSDRAAWRTRAFILAMTGDAGGAARIAASMMPGGMAQGLQPFFDRLPRLGPVDRAFAVHFGEVRASPQRIADARLAPRLPALAPEPGRAPQPVVLAAARVSSKAERKKDRRRERIDVASTPPPVPLPQPPGYQGAVVAARMPVPAPVYVQQVPRAAEAPARSTRTLPPVALASNRAVAPAITMSALPVRPAPETNTRAVVEATPRVPSEGPVRAVAPASAASAIVTPRAFVVEPRSEPAPVQVARLSPSVATPSSAVPSTGALAIRTSSTMTPSTVAVRPAPGTMRVGVSPVPAAPRSMPTMQVADGAVTQAPASSPTAATPVSGPVSGTVPGPVSRSVPGPAPGPIPGPVTGITSVPAPAQASAAGESASQPIASVSVAAITPPSAPIVPPAATLPPAPGPARGEDSILAKIIANITVPGSELDVAPVDTPPASTDIAAANVPGEPAPIATARETPRTDTQQAQRAADARANDKAVTDKVVADRAVAGRAVTDRAAADKKLADKKLADRKIADAKKLADTKAAEAKKLADAKAADLKKKTDPKLLEPARIWVQVAGGANEGGLAKEWTRVKTKAPVAFKGKTGWTTPLRATNRVLTGPFKTDAEARSFVNALSKEGVSGFSFTSEAGQKVSRLGDK